MKIVVFDNYIIEGNFEPKEILYIGVKMGKDIFESISDGTLRESACITHNVIIKKTKPYLIVSTRDGMHIFDSECTAEFRY